MGGLARGLVFYKGGGSGMVGHDRVVQLGNDEVTNSRCRRAGRGATRRCLRCCLFGPRPKGRSAVCQNCGDDGDQYQSARG